MKYNLLLFSVWGELCLVHQDSRSAGWLVKGARTRRWDTQSREITYYFVFIVIQQKPKHITIGKTYTTNIHKNNQSKTI